MCQTGPGPDLIRSSIVLHVVRTLLKPGVKGSSVWYRKQVVQVARWTKFTKLNSSNVQSVQKSPIMYLKNTGLLYLCLKTWAIH